MHQLINAYIPRDVEVYEGEINVWVANYVPDKRRKMDSDNVSDKYVNDALIGRIVDDDDQIRWAATMCRVDRKNPRVEVTIEYL